MGDFSTLLNVPTESVTFPVRAVYYRDSDGGLRLARVESFSRPIFTPAGWEKQNKAKGFFLPEDDCLYHDEHLWKAAARENSARAIRRAKQNAFDLIMCNPDMDLFATFTYSPDAVEDKSSYRECYRYLNTFLSNRVQRKGLKYVCAPERTKAGDIHFHMICNGAALQLARAFSPYTGKPLKHGKKQLYNLPEWRRGFSSAEFITDIDDGGNARERVSKYIFKYIGKDMENKIGGRYLLTGGDLARPVFLYGECKDEFSTDLPTTYQKKVHKPDIGVHYEADFYI